MVLTRQDRTALWNRAEVAKVDLSSTSSVRVQLPGGGDAPEVELTADWFERTTAGLTERIVGFIEGVYRVARLTLDRGGAR